MTKFTTKKNKIKLKKKKNTWQNNALKNVQTDSMEGMETKSVEGKMGPDIETI